jgi:hypothetical protein
MTKRLKVYLPKWMRWFILALLAPVWGLMLYETIFGPDRADRLPPVGFALVSTTLLLVAVFVWLSSAGRLPTHIVEIEEDDAAKPR